MTAPRIIPLSSQVVPIDVTRTLLKKRKQEIFCISQNNLSGQDDCQDENQHTFKRLRRCSLHAASAPSISIGADFEGTPDEYIRERARLNGKTIKLCPTNEMSHFEDPTDEQIAAYSHEILDAARQNDVEALRKLHQSGRNLRCRNRFGESLLHMSCRRGFSGMVEFLLKEVGVCVDIRDDYGRTPMHDACWSAKPNFDIMHLLLQETPKHLTLTDKRGFTPFAYTRREDSKEWVKFLHRHKALLQL